MLVNNAKKATQVTWWGYLRYLPLKRKVAMFKALVRSRYEYGLGLLPTKKGLLTKLDSETHVGLTRMMRMPITVSKLGVRWCLGVESAEERQFYLAQGLTSRLLVQAENPLTRNQAAVLAQYWAYAVPPDRRRSSIARLVRENTEWKRQRSQDLRQQR